MRSERRKQPFQTTSTGSRAKELAGEESWLAGTLTEHKEAELSMGTHAGTYWAIFNGWFKGWDLGQLSRLILHHD